jgi:hypothetical protein
MPYDFVIDQDRGILRVRYSGVVTLEERRSAAEHILGHVASPDMRRILLDYRPATSLAADEASATALADYLTGMLAARNTRVAWLVNYDHQLDPLVEGKLRERGIATARFRDQDEAIGWLRRDSDGTAGPRNARGTFEVKVAPQAPDNPPAQGAGLMRLSLDKRYSGPLEGVGQGEMLADGGGDRKDGAYVAIERVTGTLHGRAGSFVLVHRSLMRNGTPEGWSIVVSPGSGTGDLAGIDGSLRITVEHGTHAYDFDYTLPG